VRVVVAGGHGQIGLRLLRRLADGGHEPVGLIRRADQADDIRQVGAEPLVLDLEAADEVSLDADAIVFAAGAGPGSGAARKWSMDYGGAAKLMKAGPRRYLMVSAMGASDPPGGDEVFAVYLQAKAKADQELRASGLDYTIVRPGGLTDDPGTGRVRIGERLERGYVPRDDVAAVLYAALDRHLASGATFDLVSGDQEIEEALESLSLLGG
jgi:nucleoside-diphosphate-sugar epimerase